MEMKQQHKGIACIVLSAFCFALMNLFVRLSGDLPSIQKSFFRNFVAAIFAAALLYKERKTLRLEKECLPYLLLRSVFGTVGILGNFYAIDHLVLADASMLNKMSPFFAVVFSFLVLGEKLAWQQALFIAGAFVGSMFVVKPTFSNLDLIPSLAGLMGGMCAGAAYTMVRKLGELGVKGPFVVFFFSAFSCLVTLPWLVFDYHPMSGRQLASLLLAGCSAAGGQFSITAAYFYAPAKEISVYDYSQIIFAAGLGFLVFGQVPDAFSWLGYLIICAMAVMMFLYNNRILPGKKNPLNSSG